jgi:spore coat protein A
LITRRRFLERTGILAAGISVSKLPSPQQTTLDPDQLAPYVDPLPIPEIARPSGMRPSPDDPGLQLPYYRMAMRAIESKVHRDLPATRMWGFGSSSPGPTFETRSNHGLIVEWVNQLPQRHFLPIDHTLHGAEANLPQVRSVIHQTAMAIPNIGASPASLQPSTIPTGRMRRCSSTTTTPWASIA